MPARVLLLSVILLVAGRLWSQLEQDRGDPRESSPPTKNLGNSSTGLAQAPAGPNAPKAPPEVEEALRARIGEFYQAHVDGKFRHAYDLVADDSKDFYFAMEKERYLDFSILKIEFLENFTKAKAVVACGREVAALGKRYQVKMPMVTEWVLEGGKWFWHHEPAQSLETPFGTMRPGPGTAKDVAQAKQAPRLQALQNLVKVDKRDIKLSMSEPSSEQVIVTNHLPGAVSLSVDFRPMPGLEVTLDRTELNTEETATILFRYNPPAKGPKPMTTAVLRVSPTNQSIPFRITFSARAPGAAPPADPQALK